MALHNFPSNFVFRKEGNSALLLNINFPVSFTLNILNRVDGSPKFSLISEVEMFLYKEEIRRRTHFIVFISFSTTVGAIGLARQLTVSLLSCLVFLIFNRFATFHLRKTEISKLHVALVRGSKTPHEC